MALTSLTLGAIPTTFTTPARSGGIRTYSPVPAASQDQDLVNNTLSCSNVIGRFGNASVGSLVGPGTVNLSLGLAKDFQLTERFKLKFESSFTNLPNHPNFDDPRNNLTERVNNQGTFGQVLASRTGDAGGNRVGQLALRIEF